MDIQVASNFERILFEALGRDGAQVKRLYDQFAQSNGFDIPAPAMEFLRERFSAAAVDDKETVAMMEDAWNDGYMACPHTAVGLRARAKVDPSLAAPTVTLATAHPAKFPDTVKGAIGVTPPLPSKCADLFSRAETVEALSNDAAKVKAFISGKSRAWA
jgi:threonine synthase